MTATIAEIQLLVDVTRTTYYVRKGQEKVKKSFMQKTTDVFALLVSEELSKQYKACVWTCEHPSPHNFNLERIVPRL